MKKLVALMLIVLFFAGCNQDEIKRLHQKNDSIAAVVAKKDASLNEFLSAFNEIQANLDSIKAKEKLINGQTANGEKLGIDAKNRIKNDIESIYQLLIDNKAKLANMRKRLGNTTWQIKQLGKMIDRLNAQLEAKNVEIDSLRSDLEKMHIQVEDLNANIAQLEEAKLRTENALKEKEENLEKEILAKNEVWYTLGTKKELLTANVIKKEGGFIGIGSVAKLKSNFDKSIFTKADKRMLKTIPVPGKKVYIITDHPEDSYTFVGEGDDRKLEIVDAGKFWSISKYLVIQIK